MDSRGTAVSIKMSLVVKQPCAVSDENKQHWNQTLAPVTRADVQQHEPCRSHESGFNMASPIGILWSLLSTMVAGTCSFSFMQPYWFINPTTLNGLGMYSYCAKHREERFDKQSKQLCGVYGRDGNFDFAHLPSSAWQAACVLFGGGCAFLCIAAVLALVTLCVPKPLDKKIAIWTGYIQTLAVMIMVAGLVIYPLGLDSHLVRKYCNRATLYFSGDCHIGWGYMLAIMGTALSIFCPFLSHYTDMRVHERMDRFNQNIQRPAYRYV